EAWVRGPADVPDKSAIIAKGTDQNGTSASEQFCLDVSAGVYRFFTRGGGNSIYEADATVGPDDTWHHVVGVYDNAGGSLYIYVNGELQGSGTVRPSGLRAASALVSIGSKRDGVDPAYND